MEEKIIEIIEVTGYCEITDTDITFSELEIEDDAFDDIMDVIEEELGIVVSKKEAAELKEGTVKDFILFMEENAED